MKHALILSTMLGGLFVTTSSLADNATVITADDVK